MDFLTIVWTKFIRTWLKPKKQQPRNNSACRCFHPFDGNFTCEIINIIWINRLYCARKLQKAFIRSSSLSYIHSWWIHSHELYLVISFFFVLCHPSMTINLSIKPCGKGFFSGHRQFQVFFAFFQLEKKGIIKVHKSTFISFSFGKVVSDCEWFRVPFNDVFMGSLLMNFSAIRQKREKEEELLIHLFSYVE